MGPKATLAAAVLGAAFLVIFSCQNTVTSPKMTEGLVPGPTPTEAVSPSASTTPTPSATPGPTAAPTPTTRATAAPTATPTPAPSPVPLASSWYLLNSGATTPSGFTLTTAKGTLTGYQPTQILSAAPTVWYTAPVTGSLGAGTTVLTLWTNGPGTSTVVEADLLETNTAGGAVTVLGTVQVDVNSTGAGNHSSQFSLPTSSATFSNQLLAVRLTWISGGSVTAVFNSNDFDSFLTLGGAVTASPSPTATPAATAAPTPAASVTPTPVPTVDPTGDPWANQSGWNLSWHDEFNGSSVDTTKWTYDLGGGGWGNGELETYTTANASIGTVAGESCLVITADSSLNSARLKTQGLYSATYGRVEARMKLPAGQGMWPAFWMLGSDINSDPWPGCGEIDIMEMIGGDPGSTNNATTYGTIHWLDALVSGQNDSYQPEAYSLTTGQFSDGFHTFGVEWNSTTITFYLDGVAHGSATINLAANGSIFQKPFFLLLNLAVGGSWPGSPDGQTTYPQTLAVDWVRVYTQ